MGMLLGKYVPLEMLVRMPLPFVHCLRDIRLQQLEEQKRRQDILNTQMKHPVTPQSPQPYQPPNIGMVNDAELDDIVEDLAGI